MPRGLHGVVLALALVAGGCARGVSIDDSGDVGGFPDASPPGVDAGHDAGDAARLPEAGRDAAAKDQASPEAAATFTIGGKLTGLVAGETIVLDDDKGDALTLTHDGAFTFATPLAAGAKYAVTVGAAPRSPAETCAVKAGSGAATANVTDVKVTCALATACGRFTKGYAGAWSTVAANPFGTTMGLSGYVPMDASASMYLNDGSSFDGFVSATETYSPLAAPPSAFPPYGSTAWVAGSLWSVTGGSAIRYDTASGVWSTPTTGLTTATENQTTSDDAGHLWSFASEGVLFEYDTATATVGYFTLPTPLTSDEPRITFDSCSGLLYLTDFSTLPLYSYDPVAHTQVTLASLPGGATFQDGFCGDRSGHLFALIEGSTVYQFTIATGVWEAMPTGGPTGGLSSACGVGGDGFLYATDPQVSSDVYTIVLE